MSADEPVAAGGKNRARVAWSKILTFKHLSVAVLAVFFIWPTTYDFVARYILPASYYQVAEIMNPPEWRDMAISVDIPSLDAAPKDLRLDRAIGLDGQIARLNKDDYKPGRAEPTVASRENSGKVWTGKQCLFISDVALVTLSVTHDDHGDVVVRRMTEIGNKSDPADTFLNITGSELSKRAKQAGKDPAEFLRANLQGYFDRNKVPSADCSTTLASKVAKSAACSRIAIWAHGVPAPCSIWPF